VGGTSPSRDKNRLFLFNEPTVGLHMADVQVLMDVLQRLVDEGHSVLVVEHNLDVIAQADWIMPRARPRPLPPAPGPPPAGSSATASLPQNHSCGVPPRR